MANTKITSRVLADNAVLTANITDANVTTAKVADNAVTGDKVADDVALAGNPTTTTQSAGNNTTRIATTAFVSTAVANLADSAPDALNTLNELAAAMGDDANFSTTVTNSIAAKLPLAGGTMTGNIVMGDDTSIGIADDAERIEFDGAGDINILGANLGIGTSAPKGKINSVISTADNSSSSDTTLANSFLHLGGGEYGSGRYFLTTYGYSTGKTNSGAYIGGLGTSSAGAGKYALVFGTRDATTDTAPTERMRIDTSGYVGIGTTTANKLFNLADPAQGGETLKLHFEADSGTDKWAIYSYDRTNGHYADLSFGGNYLYLKSGGNVGIGTASPATELEVKAASGYAELRLQGASGSSGAVEFYNASSKTGDLYFDASNNLILRPAGTERMRIDSSGNVGIGTTSPDQLIHIASTTPIIRFEETDDNQEYEIGSYGGAFALRDVTNNAYRLVINSSGNITAASLNQTGSTSNRYPLYWVHTGSTGSIEPYTGSVRAMKTDIADMGSVDWIHSLTPRSFKFRDYTTDSEGNRTYLETTNDLPNTEYGLIAEEVDAVTGSDYILDKDADDNVKGVLYHNLVPLLLKAIQELEARIKTLEDA